MESVVLSPEEQQQAWPVTVALGRLTNEPAWANLKPAQRAFIQAVSWAQMQGVEITKNDLAKLAELSRDHGVDVV